MFDVQDGRVAYAILDFDGWFNIGGRHVAVPWQALKLTPGAQEVTLTVEQEKLRQAPGFAPTAWPTTVERPWVYDVYNYYGYEPYPALRARTGGPLEVASAAMLIGRDVENRRGWLGLGEKLAAIPWQSLKADPAERQFILDVTTDQLKPPLGGQRERSCKAQPDYGNSYRGHMVKRIMWVDVARPPIRRVAIVAIDMAIVTFIPHLFVDQIRIIGWCLRNALARLVDVNSLIVDAHDSIHGNQRLLPTETKQAPRCHL
jgi:hypothetical protein